MEISSTFVYLVLALVSVAIYFIRGRLSFWKDRGIPHDAPHLPEGNMKGFKKNRHFRDILMENYKKYKNTGPFGGFYFFLNPAAVIYDLDLVKDVLIKDFHNFADRGLFSNERDDPLTGHLFALDGPKWKNLRSKLSPTFTSGKMKFMFPTVVSVADNLLESVERIIAKDPSVEVKDLLARFTVDVIGTCAFGLECNSLKDPDAEFRIMGAKAFVLTRHSNLINGFIFSFPRLCRMLHLRQIHEDIHQFYMRVVRETVEYREKNNVKRNDFMNLLIELKNSGEGMTLGEVAAQAFVFLLAGFETSSTTMGFTLFELALHQDVQDKLRAEVNDQFEKNGGKLTYEAIQEMPYMEMVVKETLRKYSIVVGLFRHAEKDYPTSDPKYTIPKGSMVIIPIDAIHRDPEIFPDPEKFDPERFSPEELKKRHPMTWLPFGEGPRHCIGLRFGKMQAYVGLATLLRKYKFHLCNKTPNPLEIETEKTFGLLSVKGGIYLQMKPI